MRLHHLTVTAFGPFPDTEVVDFDELCDAGLFLLTGPTGAGKTSLLDAVCFALYGTVPGVRGVKALKSQHAPVDRQPEVILDFSIADRRFTLRRSPEWTRPKRRGEGTRTENAAATLIETTSGSEHLLSSRAQEVGHLVSDLIGMRPAQFVQVAMLPQGDFQRFLRATSQERHDVLEHLFRSDRFSRIEDWVHDHSRKLRDRSSQGQSNVQRLLDTIADRAEVTLPEELSGADLASLTDDDRVSAWVGQVVGDVRVEHSAAAAQHATAGEELTNARAEHDRVERLVRAATRRDQAAKTLDVLEATADQQSSAEAALADDLRASRLLPVLDLYDNALRADRDAARARDRALDELSTCRAGTDATPVREVLEGAPVTPGGWTTSVLASTLESARSRAAQLDALKPRAEALEAGRRRLEDLDRSLGRARDARHEALTKREALPAREAEAAARLETASRAANRQESLTLQLTSARLQLSAAEQRTAAEQRLVGLRDHARDTRDRAADARALMQDLQERRLAGIAAELAGRLEPGEACLVCGGTEHPHSARPADDAVTDADQTLATAAFDAAQDEYLNASAAVSECESLIESLRTQAGGLDPVSAAATVADLSAQLEDSRTAEHTRAETEEELETLAAERDQMLECLSRLDNEIAALTEGIRSQDESVLEISQELEAALGAGFDETSLGRLADELRRLVALLTDAQSAFSASLIAAERVTELRLQVDEALAAHGFTDIDQARRASLEAAERARLEELLQERAETSARARAVLDDPEVVGLDADAVPELAPAVSTLAAATDRATECARSLHLQEQTLRSLEALQVRLKHALDDWAPLRENYVRAESMSKLVRGMGTDNQLQMRLSAYVLATRLDQVVNAANERLAHMRDQRYLLQRTGRSARKGAQAGLGLEMVDQWTGDVRDPLTLSGGETFVVSLALALGLADVVTHESGGTEIQTLFVDEGFGTLDADTLDDVMDRLDALRAGGRAVGVVSHVSELRNRIPTQVHVEKTRSGSSVTVRTLVG